MNIDNFEESEHRWYGPGKKYSANFIQTRFGEDMPLVIAAKAPHHQADARNFWRMVVQHKVRNIICLASNIRNSYESETYIPF